MNGRKALPVSAAIGLAVLAAGMAPSTAPTPDAPLVKTFRADCAAKATAAKNADTMTAVGKDGWLFFATELWHVSLGKFWGEQAGKLPRLYGDIAWSLKPEYADPLPAILDFKEQLDKLAIELVMVPVPPKAFVYPDMICDAIKPDAEGRVPRLDADHREFYRVLEDKGVRVLDMTDVFLKLRAEKGAASLYCKQDTHWSGAACVLTAGRVAGLVKDRPWLKDLPKLKLAAQDNTIEITGDLWNAVKDAKPPKEKLAVRQVGTKTDSGLELVESDKNSPVLLLGDSHCLVFHAGMELHGKGAGLADQLAMELGIAIDVLGVRGSGATPSRINLYRRAKADNDYLGRKKLIIWCLGAREFTESTGWRNVPVKPAPEPTSQ